MVHKLRRMSAPLLALAVVALLGLCGAPRPAAAAGVTVINVTQAVLNPLGGVVDVPTTIYVYPDGSAYQVGRTHVANPTHTSAVLTGEGGGEAAFFDPVVGHYVVTNDFEIGVASDGTLTFYAVFYP